MDRRRSPGGGPPPPRRERPYPPHEMRDHDPREPRVREPRGYRPEPPEMRGERRRPRSSSPSYERYAPPPPRGPRMSPPPPKRYRRADEYYDRYEGPPSPEYRRGGPPPRERREERMPYQEEPRPPPPHARPVPFNPTEPMSFKQFLLRLEDDVKPEEAQLRYQGYLEEFYGGKIRAEFEMKKSTESLKARFDPRFFEQALSARNEEAVTTAKKFAEDYAEGVYKPEAEDFNQGTDKTLPPRTAPLKSAAMNGKAENGEEAMADGGEVASAPVVCWRPERVAFDTQLSRRLMVKLDEEKGIQENPLLAKKEPAAAAEGEVDAVTAPKDEAQADSAMVDAVKEESGEVKVTEGNLEEHLHQLDLQLTYLYTVHGVDYYAGAELDAEQYGLRLKAARLLRGPCPEEGEDADAAADKAASEQLKVTVDGVWAQRLKGSDPLEAKCQRQRIEEEVEAWVQGQVEKHDEKKWGSKLSNKLFMAEYYVVKHIKNKHAEAVTKEREKIVENIYFENFKAAREAEQKQRQKEQQAAAAKAAAAAHAAAATVVDEPGFQEAPYEEFEEEMEEEYPPPYPGRGMRGRGRGRGMRGMGRRPPMLPMEGGMIPPMMGMPGPMFIPAPGAGPMGPFILAPMPPPGGPIPMEMDPMAFGMRRGGRGMRGRGRGYGGGGFGMAGPGAKLDPRGIREYYDLDAPSHNRAVLDYSDL